MSKNGSNNQRSIINIGTPLMVVILIGMSFAVIAALSLSSSKNNYDLSENLADHTKEYYEACNIAYETINENCWEDMGISVPINDTQQLEVETENHTIIKWQVENISDWDGDTDLTVISD